MPSNQYSTAAPRILHKRNTLQTITIHAINHMSSPRKTRTGNEPERSGERSRSRPSPYLTLFPLFRQAEAIRDRIERTVCRFPRLAVPAGEYLAQEMANVSDAYFDGISGEYSAEAQNYIEESITRMEGFYNDLANRIRADRGNRGRAFTDPGPPPLVHPAGNAPSRTGESSAIGAGGNEPPRSLGVQPGEPENDPAKDGLMHPGERVRSPLQPVRTVTFGGTTLIQDSPPGPPMKRSLTFMSMVRSLRRNPGESKREKVKDLWRRVRNRLRREDPSS
ncbi:hypothetical protein HOY80DRAFT_1103163 [Tuber brumale]|nr:hypothetical protein HOY80DRAFT_1103163 [Tuber brumale]